MTPYERALTLVAILLVAATAGVASKVVYELLSAGVSWW